MTQHQAARVAVEAWCRAHKMKLTCRPRHVYPRCYIVAQIAAGCLIIAKPWIDGEPHMREWDRENQPHEWVRLFDKSLKTGDWCITAYICRPGCGEHIAVPIPYNSAQSVDAVRRRRENPS